MKGNAPSRQRCESTWEEKWLEVWIYMDSWVATWKEHDWKIRDKDIGVDE